MKPTPWLKERHGYKSIIDLEELTTIDATAIVEKYLSECWALPWSSVLLLDVVTTRDDYDKVTAEAKQVFELFKFVLEVVMERMVRGKKIVKR